MGLILVFSFAACKKKEEQQLPQTQVPMASPGQMPPGQMPPGQMPPGQMPPGQMPPGQMPPGQMPPGQMPPGQMPPGQMPPGAQQMGKPGMMMAHGKTQIVVPPDVKGKWSGAKIIVEDKATKAKQEYTVKLNTILRFPTATLRFTLESFFPRYNLKGRLLLPSRTSLITLV